MASAQASPSRNRSLERHLQCSICMDSFVDPVTTSCGHSFCRECLRRNFRHNDTTCPLCKEHQRGTPNVNIVLKNITEDTKKVNSGKAGNRYTGAPGEVACDVCEEPKLRAEKSCLMCVTSYCSTHLENHSAAQRLKGHKLVDPVANLDDRACLQHGRPLELFSRKAGKCICVLCMKKDQEVVPIEDEWNRKKAKLENVKLDLREKIERRITRIDEINESLKSCEDQLDEEERDIDAVFTAVITIVEEAYAAALQPLKDRRQVVEREAKDIEEKLEAEIEQLEQSISVLEDISALEDHILFLQTYPSLQEQDNIKDCPEGELDTSLSFGTLRKITDTMLESIQQELKKLTPIELQRIPKFTVDVTLDPTTAHQCLEISDDGKEVKDSGENQRVPDSLERFDMHGSVLGLNRFSSGKSYWEVEVGNKTGWDLGVARGRASRKGKLSLTPDNGYWVTVHFDDNKYAALTVPPVPLSLEEKPQTVGVFLDYDEGLVSFYDVTTKSHIYSFTGCLFSGDILPYFSPHVKTGDKNMDPLIISSLRK
ncbi:E3 ubiquitin-protein ligase TRIM21-like [Halichoeres trimaculatus]|uniref:E3 ubiquitin-protein ligase TRIM21-like n=1 Tax=Halichoeres trimaculatus TaxID=147232 RepID=UPI003D9DDE1D